MERDIQEHEAENKVMKEKLEESSTKIQILQQSLKAKRVYYLFSVLRVHIS